MGLIPGWGRSPGEGNGNPLQHSCLKNPMDRGAWWATVQGGGTESDTTSTHIHTKTMKILPFGCEFKTLNVRALAAFG